MPIWSNPESKKHLWSLQYVTWLYMIYHLQWSWLAFVRTITGPVSDKCEYISSLVTWTLVWSASLSQWRIWSSGRFCKDFIFYNNKYLVWKYLIQLIQGVSKKRYFSDFLSYFSSRGRIVLFHMCFGIRILSPFQLAIQKVSIQNLNCPKNAKNACADMIFIPAQSSLHKAGIKILSSHAFLGQLRFWMDTF